MVLVFIWLAFTTISFARNVTSIASDASEQLRRIEQDDADISIDALARELADLDARFVALESDSGAFFTIARSLEWMPVIGHTLSSIPIILDGAAVGIELARDLVDEQQELSTIFKATNLTELDNLLADDEKKQYLKDSRARTAQLNQLSVESYISVRDLDNSNLYFGVRNHQQTIARLLEKEVETTEWLEAILGTFTEVIDSASEISQIVDNNQGTKEDILFDNTFLQLMKQLSSNSTEFMGHLNRTEQISLNALIVSSAGGSLDKPIALANAISSLANAMTTVLESVSSMQSALTDTDDSLFTSGLLLDFVTIGRELAPELTSAFKEIDSATEIIGDDAKSNTDSISSRGGFAGMIDQVQTFAVFGETFESDLDLMADLLGESGPTDVLVLLSTSDELRPAGGFVSAIFR